MRSFSANVRFEVAALKFGPRARARSDARAESRTGRLIARRSLRADRGVARSLPRRRLRGLRRLRCRLGLLLRRFLRGLLRRPLARRLALRGTPGPRLGRLLRTVRARCRGGSLLLRGFLAAGAALRRRREQGFAFLERQRLRVAILRDLRVLRAVRDIRAV